MEIIGYILVGYLLGQATILGFLMMINNLGYYNIGGATNGFFKRVLTLLYLTGVGYAWFYYINQILLILTT